MQAKIVGVEGKGVVGTEMGTRPRLLPIGGPGNLPASGSKNGFGTFLSWKNT